MTDSLTQSDIDRIYGRLQMNVDLKEVTNKREFSRQIKMNPKTKKWNTKLNDFFWDVHKFRDKIERKERFIIRYKESIKQKSYFRGKGNKWTDYEIKYLERLKSDGLNVSQIANQLYRTKSSIYTKLSRIRR